MDQAAPRYAKTEPFDTRRVAVGGGHELYLEQSGDPNGLPAVFLHGGPGSGCQAAHRALFDPARFRAVLFDQRGAGLSTPKRGLAANTTRLLVADIETLREALGIERWLVVGGSWGALLAVAYAEAHPARVTGLVLRAVILGEDAEIDWAFRRGPQTFYPELWRAFRDLLPAAERGDPLAAYGARLEHPDPRIHGPAARVWHDYERALSELRPASLALPACLDAAAGSGAHGGGDPATPFFEWHYIKHRFFLEPGELLARAGRLAGIPGVIVQGRYDLLCPPQTAQSLAERWPGAALRIAEGAGHALSEAAVHRAVLQAIQDLGKAAG